MQFLVVFVSLNQISHKKMYTLILDTSFKIALIALIKENAICECHAYVHANQLSKSFFPVIKSILRSHPKIHRIAVGMGPGSYTGTRVGVTTARALSFGLGVDLGSFYSPLAYLPKISGRFCFLLPNKSNQFLMIKGMQNTHFLESDHPELIEQQELPEKLSDRDYVISHCPLDQFAIPCYSPIVNPQALTPALDNIFSSTTIKEIFYQHTPI